MNGPVNVVQAMPARVFQMGGDTCPYETCRRLVREGTADGAAELWRGERRVWCIPRLYRAASLTAREEPRLSIVRWKPHPRAVVHARVVLVVAAEHAAMDAAEGRRATMQAGAT